MPRSTASENAEPRDASDLDLPIVTGDAMHRAQRALGLIPRRGGFGLGRRIAVAVALTWLPLVVWAIWQRHLLPGVVQEPLLQHFGIHTRLLLALPLFFVAEATIDKALHRIVPQFVSSGLVDDALRPSFIAILRDTARLRDSRIALAVMLGLVALATVWGGSDAAHNHELVWSASDEPGRADFDFGAAWFSYVSRPVFLLVLVAWLWRLVLVARAFSRIAKLDLRLSPTHPDRAGGLGFVAMLPPAFAPLLFGLSVVIAGRWGHDALYHGLDVRTLQIPAGVLVVAGAGIGLVPLLVFAGPLRKLRRSSLATYGALLAEHGRLFQQRWIWREPVADAEILAAPEIGPVADTIALYQAVAKMRAAPISRRSVVPLALAIVLPLLPVFATQMPLKEVAKTLLMPLIGI